MWDVGKQGYGAYIMVSVGIFKPKITQTDDEYNKALRAFEEFKKLRQEIGKPVRGFTDREEAIRDLCGDSVGDLEKEIEKTKSRYVTT